MPNVFLVVFDELFAIISNTHLKQYINIDKDFPREVCGFLVPFDEIFQQLSETQRPTLHRVIPFRQYLLDHCETKHDHRDSIKRLKRFLSEWKQPNMIE